MQWDGKPQKLNKYSNSTFNGTKIGFLSITKHANYNDDGFIVEKTFVNILDEDGLTLESYITPSYELDPYNTGDYIICAIQDEKGVDVQK